jgi:asparagine synthase (glutamine-hydrolysing)
MSAILGVFNFGQRTEMPPPAAELLRAMSHRGGEVSQEWGEDGIELAVSRFAWEGEAEFSGSALVVQDEIGVLVADASIYQQDGLRRRLRKAGVEVRGSTASDLILAAYRAWGDQCAQELNGDFAFVLFDRAQRKVVCARDHSGVRPLFYAQFGQTLVLASTIGGVIAHPECPTDLDLATLALETGMMLFSLANATCYQAVHALPAGSTAVWSGPGTLKIEQWWNPVVRPAARPLADAAEQLRWLLGEAVAQRVDGSSAAAVWLSGGWDSSAVYGAGRHRLGTQGSVLRPVSMSYPEGDSGREDGMIQAIVDHWGASTHWVDGGSLPTIEFSGAGARHEPSPFYFEAYIRCLARAARDAGTRNVLTGHGGNYLFASSLSFLSDLLSRGRFLRLRQEWRSLRVPPGVRTHFFLKWAVRPALSGRLLRTAEAVRGKRIYGTYERPLPPWFAPDFVARHGLQERARQGTPRAPRGMGCSEHELHWFLTHPVLARLTAQAFEASLAEGIEQRAPLYDKAVVEFAAAGAWYERYSKAGTKRLLRLAMKDLLPDVVLADRFGRRDGTLQTYVERSMNALWPHALELFRRPVLAEMGLVDPVRLKTEMERYASGRASPYFVEQFICLAHTESWFRAKQFDGSVGIMDPVLSLA